MLSTKRKEIGQGGMDPQALVHLNNFIFLVMALSTNWIYTHNTTCKDDNTAMYLKFVLYGNLLVYSIIFFMQALYYLNLLDSLTKKIGAVCLTINTYVFASGVYLFDLISMIYGIHTHFFTDTKKCKELQLFSMCCAYVFLTWFIALIIGALSKWWSQFRGEEDRTKFIGMM